MDLDDNPRMLWAGLSMLALFLGSCCGSCTEIRYRWSGKQATAVITQIAEERGRRGRVGFRISYQFFNENHNRSVNGYTIVPTDEVAYFNVGQEVEIEYIGGKDFSSRIVGQTYTWAMFLFFGSILALIGFTVFMVIYTRQQARKSRRKRLL